MALQTVPVVHLPSAWLRPCSLPVLGTALLFGSLVDEAQAQNGWKWFGKSPAPVTQPAAPRNGFSVAVERLMDQARQEANAGQFDQAIKTAQRAHKISEAAAGVLGTDPTCSPAMTRQFLNDMVALQDATQGLPSATIAQTLPSSPVVRPSIRPEPPQHVVIPRTPQPAVAAAQPAQIPSSAIPAPPPVSLRKMRPVNAPAASTATVAATQPVADPSVASQTPVSPMVAPPTAPAQVASKINPVPQRPVAVAPDVTFPEETSSTLIGLNEFSITGGEEPVATAREFQKETGVSDDLIPFNVLPSEPTSTPTTVVQNSLETPQAEPPESIVVDLGLPQSGFEIVGNNEVFRPQTRAAIPLGPTRVEWSSKAPAVAVRISPAPEESQADSALPEWDDGEAAVNSFAQSATAPLLDFNEDSPLSPAESESLQTTLHELSMMVVDLQTASSASLNTAALLPVAPQLSDENTSNLTMSPAVTSSDPVESKTSSLSTATIPASPVFVMSLSPIDEVPLQKVETDKKETAPAATVPTSVASATPVMSPLPATLVPAAITPVKVQGTSSETPQTSSVAPIAVSTNLPEKGETAVVEKTTPQPVQKTESVPVAAQAVPSVAPGVSAATVPTTAPAVKEAQPLAKAVPVPLITEITTLSAVEKDRPAAAVITPAVDRGRPGVLVTEEDLPTMPAPTEWSSPSIKRSTSPAKRTPWVDPSWSPVGRPPASDENGKAVMPGAAIPEAAPSAITPKTTSAHNEHEEKTVALAEHAVTATTPSTADISLVSATSLEIPAAAPALPANGGDDVLIGPAVWMREEAVKQSMQPQPQMSATRPGPMERAAQQYGMSTPVAPWLAGAMGLFCLLTGYFWMRRSTSEVESV